MKFKVVILNSAPTIYSAVLLKSPASLQTPTTKTKIRLTKIRLKAKKTVKFGMKKTTCLDNTV